MLFSIAVAALVAAAPARHAPAPCKVSVYAPAGTYAASTLTGKPGLVLSGGGLSQMPHAPVFAFIRERIRAPKEGRAGNLLILKASGARDYSDDFYKESRLGSVREILIPPCASRAQADVAAAYVDRADAVLFAGGDQAHYVAWKGGTLIAAVRRLYARGGVEGGGSAGLAIQGAVIYDAVGADRVLPDDEDLQTRGAVLNPYQPAITFTTDFFAWPPLGATITDTHVARRDRFGRLATFMARIAHSRLVNSSAIYGLAVDEGVVLLVNNSGTGTLYERTHMNDGYVPKGAWILEGTDSGRIERGTPLRYAVRVKHLSGNGSSFNLAIKRAEDRTYRVIVDGTRKPPYVPGDPYR